MSIATVILSAPALLPAQTVGDCEPASASALLDVNGVSVKVFDLLGREVDDLVDDRRSVGWHRTDWHPGRLPSSVYFIVAEADGLRRVQPVTIVK